MRAFLLAMAVTGALGGCTEDGEDCTDASALQARLDAAAPGETVTIGACEVAGPIAVPAGVRLEGGGRSATTVRLATPGAGRAITLTPGEMPTTLARLTVASDGCAGVVAIGAGRVAIEDVEVRATRGVGIAVQDATELSLTSVVAIGALTNDSIETAVPPLPPFRCGSAEIATHGVVLVSVATAALLDVRADGFGAFGLLAIESGLDWETGDLAHNLGTAVEVWGGTARLGSVAITGTRDGSGAIESYGAVFAGGAGVTTDRLSIEDGAGYGVFHDGASATHEALTVSNHGFAGVWAQAMDGLAITGDSMVSSNGFAGVAVLQSAGVSLRGLRVSETAERTRVEGVRTIRAADGVQLLDADATLENLDLQGNSRVGLLVDLAGGSTMRLAVTAVSVRAEGAALGAIAQNGTVEPGWDAAVTRGGTTAANDEAFRGALQAAGAVGPPCFPPIGALASTGLGDLVGP